ncbi:MAG: MFS transporter [Deltaproteobacteria bacterium]|nr:MAG: MFS transporter [Deltaproteobacteria bacterium]
MFELDLKKLISWSLYDWANSAFATSVMAGFFPVFFKKYWSIGTEATVSTFKLGTANSLASLTIAILAPILGAIADKGGVKKKFLLCFAFLGIVMTGSLYFVGQGDWQLAIIFYILSIIGFSGGNIFYDSLILNVAPGKRLDFVSAFGFSLGYIGGGILFAFNVVMILSPQTFGLNDAQEAMRMSFLCVATWWAIFSIPIFIFVDEPKIRNSLDEQNLVTAGFRQFFSTLKEIRKFKVVFLFLLGYWLYIDGVHTIIRMAVDYGMSLGFSSTNLIIALLITQFVGFPATLAFGKLAERLGAKTGILIGIGIYLGVVSWGTIIEREFEFYVLAIVIGLVQGGVQSLSRSFYARIIPEDKSAQFFGFYNLIGKFAAVIGPSLVGWISFLSGSPRYSILSISVLFISGAIILYFVNEEEKALQRKI